MQVRRYSQLMEMVGHGSNCPKGAAANLTIHNQEEFVHSKFGKLIVLSAALAAFLSLAAVARADGVIYGKAWEGAVVYNNPLGTSAPSGTPTATFKVTGGSQIFNFSSNSDQSLKTFLESGGDTFTLLSGSPNVGYCGNRLSSCGLNNDVIEFTGTAYLTGGKQYHITKDDAVLFRLDGILAPLVDARNNTSAETLFFTVATSGAYNFDLLYSEVNGPPAVLESNITVTPEPANLILLGTGMLLAAFAFRRQIMASLRQASASASLVHL
jgi:hypothetical protein